MTEAEWLDGADPEPLLDFLRGRVSERKLRLFACACCRRVWHLLTDPRSRRAVEAGERFVDGRASPEELEQAWQEAGKPPGLPNVAVWAAWAAVTRGRPASRAKEAAMWAAEAVAWAKTRVHVWRDVAERARQAALLREIVGNPFRSVALDPAWLAWEGGTAARLARAVYEEQALDRLPVLADALEEAGCAEAELLGHLRGPGPHVRGCWAVDLLLGRE